MRLRVRKVYINISSISQNYLHVLQNKPFQISQYCRKNIVGYFHWNFWKKGKKFPIK